MRTLCECGLLEPDDWEQSRPVLRGERGSNAPDLPGEFNAREVLEKKKQP